MMLNYLIIITKYNKHWGIRKIVYRHGPLSITMTKRIKPSSWRHCVCRCSLRCPLLRSVTLSDGEYYEMVKSNFERADRATVVRTTTTYTTSLVALLSAFKDLLFN